MSALGHSRPIDTHGVRPPARASFGTSGADRSLYGNNRLDAETNPV